MTKKPGFATRSTNEQLRLLNAVEQQMVRLQKELAELELFIKANPNWHLQPRVPAGQPNGGQWVDGGGATTNPNSNAKPGFQRVNDQHEKRKTIDVAKSVAALNKNARIAFRDTGNISKSPTESLGRCARYVRLALMAGRSGIKKWPENAKDYGPFLERWGLTPIVTPTSMGSYMPRAGDVVVIQPYPGGNPSGHIAMHDGTQWISDFMQGNNLYPGPGYRTHRPPYVIYRPNI